MPTQALIRTLQIDAVNEHVGDGDLLQVASHGEMHLVQCKTDEHGHDLPDSAQALQKLCDADTEAAIEAAKAAAKAAKEAESE